MAGAYAAAASEDAIRALSRFGEEYGLLFQITDDILDAEGDPSLLGKSVGKDAAEGKLTFVSFYGREKARELAARSLENAREALRPFGKEAAYFHTLLDTSFDRSC